MYTKMLDALGTAWSAVAPAGLADNAHALAQREITGPDGRRGVVFPALIYYAADSEPQDSSPDGRRGWVTTQFVLDFRASEYREAWSLAEAFREQLEQLPRGLGYSGWQFLEDTYGLEHSAASGVPLVPRKVAAVGFTR